MGTHADESDRPVRPTRLVVLVSGSGSNLQAIIDACADEHLPAEVVAVVSNKADVFALQALGSAPTLASLPAPDSSADADCPELESNPPPTVAQPCSPGASSE